MSITEEQSGSTMPDLTGSNDTAPEVAAPEVTGPEVADNQTRKPPSLIKLLFEFLISILIPSLILKKLSAAEALGPTNAFILAISLPLLMALYDFVFEKKFSFVAAIGFISILLTGGIGLLKLPKDYIAIKEALIPSAFALFTVISAYTKRPLIRAMIYNDLVMDTIKIDQHLQSRNTQSQFDSVLKKGTFILASSFVLSAVLNYALAKYLIVSPTGTAEFNDQLGTMNLLSYPVIVLPCMVITIYTIYYVFNNIVKLSGLQLEEIVHQD